jgi:hypothetical protein
VHEHEEDQRKGSKWEPPRWWWRWFMCLRVCRLRMGVILHVGGGEIEKVQRREGRWKRGRTGERRG